MLLREIGRDLCIMPAICLECAYWHARANWGMSEGDIRGTLLFATGMAALTFVSIAHPESRASPGFAAAILLPRAERLAAKIAGQRWFYVIRVIMIVGILAFMGAVALQSPRLFSQERGPGFYDQEIRIRANEITLERVLIRLENQERNDVEIKEQLAWIRNGIFATLGALAILFLKELIGILLSGGKVRAKADD